MTTRVVHVASGREWRGGQRQVWLLAKELQQDGNVPQVVVTGAGSELARRLAADRVPTRTASWRIGLDPRALAAVLGELRRAPSLLHAHDAHALTLAGLASWISRSPLVVTRRVDFHLRRRGFWGRADRVIAISEAVARVLRSDGIDPARIVVVHSGINSGDVAGAVPFGIRHQLGLPAGATLAANIGALVPHKDHATLLHAAGLLASRYPSLHWVVAGDGPLRRKLEQQVDTLELRGRVHLVGHLAEPLQLLADADLFVMSSREEGLGTSVLDAMARGIPVASTSAGGLPEILASGAGLLVPPGQPEALAEAVAKLVADAGLREKLGSRGRVAVRQFSAQRMAGEVRTVYRSLVPVS